MRFHLLALALFLGYMPLAFATTYYVSGTGSDASDGLSDHTAFRTIQKAADLTNPGDTVLVMDGTYTNAWWSGDVVDLKRSGTPEAWITFKNAPGQHPVISFNGWSGFKSQTASYIEISGFTIIGNNDHLTLEEALKQKDWADPKCNGNGIALDGRDQGAHLPHHYRILHNTISKCGGGGIDACEADYLNIEGNRVFDNAWYTRFGNSGMSVCVMRDFDTVPGYHILIRNNIVYNNRTLVPWYQKQALSDGNGIIIDSNNETKYSGHTLVANNLCLHNGGSGIHTFKSAHVDIVNNTTWHNSQKLDYGEIYANASSDINIINNLCVAEDGKPMNSNYGDNRNVVYDSNLFFGGQKPVVIGSHPLIADPLLIHPEIDPTAGDFHLQPESPARGAGAKAPFVPDTDLDGIPRPPGQKCDLGAYQYDGEKGTGIFKNSK